MTKRSKKMTTDESLRVLYEALLQYNYPADAVMKAAQHMVTNDITGEESREMLFNIVDSAQLMAEYRRPRDISDESETETRGDLCPRLDRPTDNREPIA